MLLAQQRADRGEVGRARDVEKHGFRLATPGRRPSARPSALAFMAAVVDERDALQPLRLQDAAADPPRPSASPDGRSSSGGGRCGGPCHRLPPQRRECRTGSSARDWAGRRSPAAAGRGSAAARRVPPRRGCRPQAHCRRSSSICSAAARCGARRRSARPSSSSRAIASGVIARVAPAMPTASSEPALASCDRCGDAQEEQSAPAGFRQRGERVGGAGEVVTIPAVAGRRVRHAQPAALAEERERLRELVVLLRRFAQRHAGRDRLPTPGGCWRRPRPGPPGWARMPPPAMNSRSSWPIASQVGLRRAGPLPG
jgi:hypothetical protein